MMRLILFLLFGSLASITFAQEADEELAARFFFNEEYDKAEILYKKLHKKNEESVYIYQNYLACLLKQNLVDDARKNGVKTSKAIPRQTPLYCRSWLCLWASRKG